jgi:hypothetical protein
LTPRQPRTASQHRIVYTPLDDLVPAPVNPKTHVDMTASFGEFGYMEPVMIDNRTGRLVGGHGRLETLHLMRRRGDDPPAGIVVRAGRWCVPTVHGWSSRDDDHAAAALIALNRYTELGGWDDKALADLLQQINDDPDDDTLLTAAGWDDKELSKLLADLPDLDDDGGRRKPVTPPDQRPGITHQCPSCGHTWNTR